MHVAEMNPPALQEPVLPIFIAVQRVSLQRSRCRRLLEGSWLNADGVMGWDWGWLVGAYRRPGVNDEKDDDPFSCCRARKACIATATQGTANSDPDVAVW